MLACKEDGLFCGTSLEPSGRGLRVHQFFSEAKLMSNEREKDKPDHPPHPEHPQHPPHPPHPPRPVPQPTQHAQR